MSSYLLKRFYVHAKVKYIGNEKVQKLFLNNHLGEIMSRIRIAGIVKAMNRVREWIDTGIPQAEVEGFRALVKDSVAQVESICREHNATPQDLPAPSRRAYQYLKSVDLENIPIREADAPPPPQRVRVKRLVAITNVIHAQMEESAKRPGRKQSRLALTNEDIADMLADIQRHVARVEEICQDSNAHPVDLPTPSRRAYEWLKFLSVPENLHTHLLALSIALQQPRSRKGRRKKAATRQKTRLHVRFYNIPHLYRYQEQQDGIHLTVHEAFIHAPGSVLKALARTAQFGRKTVLSQHINQFASTEEFAECALALESTTLFSETPIRGRHYRLVDIFQRVNEQYFDGQLSQPRLVWNKTITHRKMGHYQPASDTILISLTLDAPDIPAYVIEFVVYHEMLHKKLGVQMVNGRHYAHTSAFRTAERQFERYAEAQTFLNRLGQKLSLAR